MMSSVTSTVMSYDVILYIHQPHTITEAAGLPTFTFCSSSITGKEKDEKMTSTQLECLYTDQHTTRVLTQQTSTWLQCSHNSLCLMQLFSVFQYLSTAIIELVLSTRGARQRVE